MKFVRKAAFSKDFLKTVKVGALPITMISVTAKLIATEVAILATVSPTKLTIPAAMSSLDAVVLDFAIFPKDCYSY